MAARHLSDKTPDGTILGQSAADLIGVHGVAGTVQFVFSQSGGTLSGIGAQTLSVSQLVYGFSSSEQLLALVAEVRNHRALLSDKGWGAG